MSVRRTALASFLDGNTTAESLFIAGALALPSFLFQPDLGIRCIQTAVFIALDALCGMRVRPLQTLVAALGILAFNLVIPSGRVISTIVGFPLTDGALRGGVAKATAVIGMIALSRFSIRRALRLPGAFGGLLGRTLFYFERIMSYGKRIDRRNLMESIDALLFSAGSAASMDSRPRRRERLTLPGFALLFFIVAANWAAVLLRALNQVVLWPR